MVSQLDAKRLASQYRDVRGFTEQIAAPLSAEDCMVQSMEDVSPTRWHLAHTSWFFETFVLAAALSDYRSSNEDFRYLFNSYYNAVGKQIPRGQRGWVSRPGLSAIMDYRAHVDEQMDRIFERGTIDESLGAVIEVGLHHERQHQELILTDIKHVLSCNPTRPSYRSTVFEPSTPCPLDWIEFPEGLTESGHDGVGFAFDNEWPRHRTYLHSFQLANRNVSCGEFMEFIADGGYDRPDFWLALGWAAVQQQQWEAPLYWFREHDQWKVFTLNGPAEIRPEWPVCHVSYFEADAFARWASARLPTEFEWERAAARASANGQFADSLLARDWALHPTRLRPALAAEMPAAKLSHLLGGVWEWTSSSYAPYPGYQPKPGALGEYNGKFMCNQYVLRGGSVATHRDHIRPTYRNFFPPEARWQFSGFRLAR